MSATIVWFTGLPSSGKSTLAERTRAHLAARGLAAIVLDGDRVRAALGAHAYGGEERDAFYRALAELAALVAEQGVVALVAATAPRREHRALAARPGGRFLEVWVRTPLATCEARDAKGLYARARRGELAALPGVGVAFEPPEHPDVVAEGGLDDEAIAAIARLVAPAG